MNCSPLLFHQSVFHLLYLLFPRGDSPLPLLLIGLLLDTPSSRLPASQGRGNVHSGTLTPCLHMHNAKGSELMLIIRPHAESSHSVKSAGIQAQDKIREAEQAEVQKYRNIKL